MASNSKCPAPKSSKSLSQSVTSKRKVSGPSHSSASAPSVNLDPTTAPVIKQTAGSNESVNLDPTTAPTSPAAKKTKSEGKTRSGVWKYFDKIEDEAGEEKAKCIWCDKMYQCKSELGTSGLWGHLRRVCKKLPLEIKKELQKNEKGKDKNQKILCFQNSSGSSSGKLCAWQFDQEKVREALVRMIIKDELPFRFVEGGGFREFIEVGIPQFEIPSRYTIARDCFSLFVKEKKKLKVILESQCQNHRVSLTTDTWTSNQNLNYLCLTAHFIDKNWKLNKRILNFCIIKSHKGVNIGNVVDFCMDEWGIKKVMCITVDNASSNDTAVQQLKKRLSKKDAFVLGGEAFHMRCFCHILQLIVKDGLEIAQNSIKKIRDIVRYVRGSPQRVDLFMKCCSDVGITSKAHLQLDCPTRWNSTYLMLETALVFQKAFDKLEDVDTKYVAEFGVDVPNETDWTCAAFFTKFLKRFYDVTCKLSGSLYSTSNMYFPEILRVLKEVEGFERSDDACLVEMGKQMRTKFDKYWGTLNKMNVMLFIAVVLDPRCKINYLLVKFTQYYSDNDAKALVERVMCSLKGLVEEYKAINCEESVLSSSQSQVGIDATMEIDDDVDEYFINQNNEQRLAAKGELDIYLEELPEKYDKNFDILDWWKKNSVRFPILGSIARDVLAIQSSTVASESAFSTGGRTLDRFRSSLTPTTAEVLICVQDWLRVSPKPIEVEELIGDLSKLEIDVKNDPEIDAAVFSRSILDC